VAAKLKEKGFQRIRPLAGGFQAWVSAGFEVQEATLATDLPTSA
jgi:rhodanese-related sulfurtransferase